MKEGAATRFQPEEALPRPVWPFGVEMQDMISGLYTVEVKRLLDAMYISDDWGKAGAAQRTVIEELRDDAISASIQEAEAQESLVTAGRRLWCSLLNGTQGLKQSLQLKIDPSPTNSFLGSKHKKTPGESSQQCLYIEAMI